MKHLEHLVQELSKCPACLLPFQVVGWDNDKNDDNDNDNDKKLDDDEKHNNNDSSDNNKHHHRRRHHQISPPLRLPSRSRSCHHRICQPCILRIQVLQWQNDDNVQNEYSHYHHQYHHHHHNNTFRRQSRNHRHRNATLPCPKCSSPKSFLVNRPPPIDEELTVALECLAPPSSSSLALSSSSLSLSSLSSSSFRRNRNHHHHHYSYYDSYVSNVKQHCHEQPWRLPLGTFPHVLETIANWKSIPLAVDTVRAILQGGLLQVHDFSITNKAQQI